MAPSWSLKVTHNLTGAVLLAVALLLATVGFPNSGSLLWTAQSSCRRLNLDLEQAHEPMDCDVDVRPQDLSRFTNCTLVEKVSRAEGATGGRGAAHVAGPAWLRSCSAHGGTSPLAAGTRRREMEGTE